MGGGREGEFIEKLDEELVIDGTNEEYSKIGYRKIDSVNAIDRLSMDSKKILSDSIANIYLLPKAENYLNKYDLEHMADRANRKMNFSKRKSLGKVSFSKNRESVMISVPVFNKNNTLALLFEKRQSTLTAKFFKFFEETGWKFLSSGTVIRAD